MTDKERYHLLCEAEESIPIFSRDWWLDIACGADNWEVLLIEQKGHVHAALPLYIPRKGIVSMPSYTQTMGPWFAPEPADTKYTKALGRRQALCRQLLEKLGRHSFFLQNFHYAVTDWLPFYWAGYRQTTRYTYLLKDIGEPEILRANMSANIRRNIVKAAEKYHISVQKDVPVEDFLRVQAKTFERQRIANKGNVATLARLIHTCRERGQGDLWGGYDEEGRLHAAVFIVWQKSSAWYLAGGGDPALRESGAHSLVLWEAIRHASMFTDTFDFEGSMLPGVERFFREFGAIQTPFFTITKGKLSLIDRACLKICAP